MEDARIAELEGEKDGLNARIAELESRLKENCEFMKEVPSIPVSYPKCTHPDSKTGVCAELKDCPRG